MGKSKERAKKKEVKRGVTLILLFGEEVRVRVRVRVGEEVRVRVRVRVGEDERARG